MTNAITTDMKGTMNRKLWPLAAIALAALIGPGCGQDSDGAGSGGDAAANQTEALKFAECMRDNGVSEFPDPPAEGGLTIDGVLNGSGLDPEGPAWKTAIGACKDLQPAGFTGDHEVSDSERESRLAFAQCIRDNGVADFPDPADDQPLINTNVIPSAATDAGMSALNAAMQACRDQAPAGVGP
jgi:hypothetical protein